MILVRLFRALGADGAVDGLDPVELRAWLVELRTTLAPVSVAGYVRTLRVLGNWPPPRAWPTLRGLGRRRAHHPPRGGLAGRSVGGGRRAVERGYSTRSPSRGVTRTA